ncbi:ORF 2 [Haloarcula hispanica virus SH1]|uniref:ORF 2 n=1 Tax=Haloarcula hispanica SH1 virus TaxID=326574 RepID=Q4KPI5_9VIRU|nr:ORF 2 [Haloarcula hispanica virus SH1]AAY24928.1 ORF 2 [Haloarcula hispanica virus SH1]
MRGAVRAAVRFPLREDADPSPTRSDGRRQAGDSRAARLRLRRWPRSSGHGP